MRRALPFVLVLLALNLVACTLGPNYKRPTLDVPGSYRGQPAETNSTATPLGNTDWESVFRDEQMQSLIRTGLQQNYDVRIAAERVIAAQAVLRIAHSDQLPSAGVGAGLFSMRSPEEPISPAFNYGYGQLGAAASWELDFWGKYRKATEAARASLAATEWGRRAVTNAIIANVATSYLQLRALDLQLEITKNTLKSRQQSLQLTTVLADGGAASWVDVRQAEQLVFTASAAIPALEQEITQQEDFLSTLLGQNPATISRGLTLNDQPRLASIPPGLPSQLLERRPDIQQAEQQLVAANAQIGVAKAAMYPSISLTGSGGFQSSALSRLFTGPAGLWNVGASLVQPVFTAGRLRDQVQLSESEERQLLLAYQKTVQEAFREVSDALVAYQKTAEVRGEQEKLLVAARDSARLARVRYEAGAAAYLEVLTNETNSYAAELSLSQAKLNEMLALVQVYNALGGGWKQ